MSGKVNAWLGFLAHYKYLITIVVGVLIVGVLDDNSFRKLIQYEMEISDLKDQINNYDKQYEKDSKTLRDLKRNPKTIEKIARERYFMKADDEDIYVLSTDEQQNETEDKSDGMNPDNIDQESTTNNETNE
ncbi:MAG: septum formation initiator family protein [Prevotella sp.]|uniref:FtsB family cell division protein n=1 Tax=Prevotella sp. AGR2160 TaxID=1280674 RepID=UPI000421DAF9|nr:septum formation initiator family protein [Prevotella sp. AGR2160]MDD5862216.1 septum formation initiator family protein [Prevotella sp.]